MIFFLAACLVAVSAASITVGYLQSRRVIDAFDEAERSHRLERAAIMRAVVARTGTELGMLDRIAGQTERQGTVGGESALRKITPQEYQRLLREDLAQMGADADLVPGVPEGM